MRINVQAKREAFEKKYLKLKELPDTFDEEYYYHDNKRYEVKFNTLSHMNSTVKLHEIHGDYDYDTDEWEEDTAKRSTILNSGTKVEFRGKIVTRGNDIILKQSRLLSIE